MKKTIACVLSAAMIITAAGMTFAEPASDSTAAEAVETEAEMQDVETAAAEGAEEETSGSDTMAEGQEITIGEEETFVITVDVPASENGEVIMGDHDVIEVPISSVNVTQEDIDDYIASMQDYWATTDEETGETITPELNDEFAAEFAAQELGEDFTTVQELRDYAEKKLYQVKLHNAIYSAIEENCEIVTYNEQMYKDIKTYFMDSLSYYAYLYSTYGYDYDEDAVAQLMYGSADAETFISEQAQYYTEAFMILDKLAEEVNVEVTDEEADAWIARYMADYDYDETYTIDEFKELYGDTWVFISTELNVKFDKVMEALEDRVVMTEEAESDETAAEETVSEDSAAAEETQADSAVEESAAEETTAAETEAE